MRKETRMRQSATMGAILAVGVLILPASAEAELCDHPTQICIINPPTAAAPWVAPQVVQLRLPSEAEVAYSRASWTQPGAYYGEYPHGLQNGQVINSGKRGLDLVAAGPPGGTSLYQGTIEPEFAAHKNNFNSFLPADGALTLTVSAGHSDPACTCIKETTASFSGLSVVSTVSGFSWQIVRQGKWFRAVMSFMARAPVRVEQIFHVSVFTEGDIKFAPLPLLTRRVTAAGPVRVVQKLSVRYVQKQCSGAEKCKLFSEATMGNATEPDLQDALLASVSRHVGTGPKR